MLQVKKSVLSALVFSTLVSLSSYLIFSAGCDTNNCIYVREGFVVPAFWFGISASVISIFFLFFPAALFMSWLKRIASWYLPILFIITVTTPVNSGHIMSVDRSQVVFAGMVILGLITLVFVGFDFYRKRNI